MLNGIMVITRLYIFQVLIILMMVKRVSVLTLQAILIKYENEE